MKRSSRMRLVTIASFLVMLLCSLFGTIAAANNDFNVMTSNDIETSMNDDKLSNSCIFGVQSVSVILYTSDIPKGQVVQVNESCDLIDPSNLIYFITHGFIANASSDYFSEFATLMTKKGYSVFSLDWSDAACYHDPAVINLLEYPFAVINTREIGDYLASYAKSVIDTCHIPLKSMTFMGHSLGAHISGFAAKNLQNSGYGKIPLLIGTDPAAPLFTLQLCENRFCKSDAERVEALHTSVLGIQYSLAHLDLWFNNGLNQPACGGVITGGLNVNCSHNIAVQYLAKTLFDDCVYVGVPILRRIIPPPILLPRCSSNRTNCIVVDNRIFNSDYTTTGDYCVSVSSEDPYCTKNDFMCQE